MNPSPSEIYDPEFVSGMFDRMSKTYGFANLVTSFGFTARWRRQCVNDLPPISRDACGYDLMSGMGEAWGDLQKRLDDSGKIIAVDISYEMNRKAAEHIKRLRNKNIELRQLNALNNDLPSGKADFVVSTFGIKTFNPAQQKILAREVCRLLKPGGSFAFLEISKPGFLPLKGLYMFYLKIIIPLIGKVFLGNSDDYRMLGKYCATFGDSNHFHQCLTQEGLKSTYKKYFFGCATGVYGTRPV